MTYNPYHLVPPEPVIREERCPVCNHWAPVEDFARHPGMGGETVCDCCYREHCITCGERHTVRGGVPIGDVCEACAVGERRSA